MVQDVYRVGTLLELVRELAFTFADDGKRVRVRHVTTVHQLWLRLFVSCFLSPKAFHEILHRYNRSLLVSNALVQFPCCQVCVQGAMGEGIFSGIPLALAGTRRMLERMDWGSYIDEGTFIRFGAVGLDYPLPCSKNGFHLSFLRDLVWIIWNLFSMHMLPPHVSW